LEFSKWGDESFTRVNSLEFFKNRINKKGGEV
jgi:hypothetical protein